ncbi:MAG: hypothetical protein EPO21_15445 [Chloroflexota bacterium]|nr:MAG: hypothetical protein EPO21_15445 [Chloroflexota bacterium]
MNFSFTETQETLRKEVRLFARRELAPDAAIRAKEAAIDRKAYQKIADMGLLGINLPEKYGGAQGDWVSVGVVNEELAKVDFALASVARLQLMFCHLLMLGSEEIRQEWIPAVIRGEKLMAMAVTEPDCGADASALRLRAIRDGDCYVLDGEKTSVTIGMQADGCLVWAKTAPEAGAKGVTLFLVPLDTPGIHKSNIKDMGIQSVGRASLIFDNVRVPAANRIGNEGEGFSSALNAFDTARIFLGLESVASAEASLTQALAYAKERQAFGQPIIKFQDVSHTLAEDVTRITAARWLAYHALWLSDQGLPRTKEAAMAKWFGVDAAIQAVRHSIVVLGHVGFSEECSLEQRLRDLIGWEIADSTPGIMKMTIARALEKTAEPF